MLPTVPSDELPIIVPGNYKVKMFYLIKLLLDLKIVLFINSFICT